MEQQNPTEPSWHKQIHNNSTRQARKGLATNSFGTLTFKGVAKVNGVYMWNYGQFHISIIGSDWENHGTVSKIHLTMGDGTWNPHAAPYITNPNHHDNSQFAHFYLEESDASKYPPSNPPYHPGVRNGGSNNPIPPGFPADTVTLLTEAKAALTKLRTDYMKELNRWQKFEKGKRLDEELKTFLKDDKSTARTQLLHRESPTEIIISQAGEEKLIWLTLPQEPHILNGNPSEAFRNAYKNDTGCPNLRQYMSRKIFVQGDEGQLWRVPEGFAKSGADKFMSECNQALPEQPEQPESIWFTLNGTKGETYVIKDATPSAMVRTLPATHVLKSMEDYRKEYLGLVQNALKGKKVPSGKLLTSLSKKPKSYTLPDGSTGILAPGVTLKNRPIQELTSTPGYTFVSENENKILVELNEGQYFVVTKSELPEKLDAKSLIVIHKDGDALISASEAKEFAVKKVTYVEKWENWVACVIDGNLCVINTEELAADPLAFDSPCVLRVGGKSEFFDRPSARKVTKVVRISGSEEGGYYHPHGVEDPSWSQVTFATALKTTEFDTAIFDRNDKFVGFSKMVSSQPGLSHWLDTVVPVNLIEVQTIPRLAFSEPQQGWVNFYLCGSLPKPLVSLDIDTAEILRTPLGGLISVTAQPSSVQVVTALGDEENGVYTVTIDPGAQGAAVYTVDSNNVFNILPDGVNLEQVYLILDTAGHPIGFTEWHSLDHLEPAAQRHSVAWPSGNN